MTENERRDWVGKCMGRKGFHVPELSDPAFGGMVRSGLIGTEVAEALQEVKRHWPADGSPPVPVLLEKVALEMADVAIRCYDLGHLMAADLTPVETARNYDLFRDRDGRNGRMVQLSAMLSFAGRLFDTFEDSESNRAYMVSESQIISDEDSENCPEDSRDPDGDYDWEADHDGCRDEVEYLLVTLLTHCRLFCDSIGQDLAAFIDRKMIENMARPDRYGTPDADRNVATQVVRIEESSP